MTDNRVTRAEQVMPPVGVRVSSNVEMQKFLRGRTVIPSSGQNPGVTAGSVQALAASVTWTNAEPDTLMERGCLHSPTSSVRISAWSAIGAYRVPMA